VAVYCFTQLIQPGKREEAKNIFEEIRGGRRSEYEASRRRLGIREEKAWFQDLPQGDMAVVNWAIRVALQEFASSDDPSTSGSWSGGGRSTTSNRARRWTPIRRSWMRRSARGDGTLSSVM